jgi:aryl-alcohol dehydrogenase-like predicted oxidoreductase
VPPGEIVASLENSLRQLDTDYVDVFQLHMVHPTAYDHALNHIAPVLVREKEKGKIRALGLSETSPRDHEQHMLRRAANDPVWEVAMFAFNLMNHNACQHLFPHTIAYNIGTLLMFVVRNIFSQPERLAERMRELAGAGQVPRALATDNPLSFLVHAGGASSVVDAAYRFARHEPGAHVVLFGTGTPEHLKENIQSLLKPPLPEADRRKLAELFGHLLGVGLEFPKHHKPA